MRLMYVLLPAAHSFAFLFWFKSENRITVKFCVGTHTYTLESATEILFVRSFLLMQLYRNELN